MSYPVDQIINFCILKGLSNLKHTYCLQYNIDFPKRKKRKNLKKIQNDILATIV